jgi:hypothetical protein
VEAEQVLWEQLLWLQKEEKNSRLSIDLAAIQDDVTIVQRGVSFLSPGRVQEAERWMLKQLASVLATRRLYEGRGGAVDRDRESKAESDSDSNSNRPVQWRLQEVRRHLQHIERFLDLLSLAVHVAGGQSACGPELLSVRWRNGLLQDRNLYVIDGQVAVVTRYHKTQSQWDKPKVVVHFLPKAVGQLVAAYLLYARPLRALRYMTISIESSMEVAANQQRRSTALLLSASPHQNPRLLPRLASCRIEYLLLCFASITHYPFYLHLDFEIRYRANVNNNKRAALQQRVT